MSPSAKCSGRSLRGERIRVHGLVQGVGFRPTVWRLARELNLAGAVWNDAGGVEMEVWGNASDVENFVGALAFSMPPLARIDTIEREPLMGCPPGDTFEIVESRRGTVRAAIVPDAATCPACLAEIFDPNDRRYRYPFANCTHCGPRLSIVGAIPYDRANTSMAAFALCPDCAREYGDPGDRRFHAQPIACPRCGPKVWLENGVGEVIEPQAGDVIHEVARLIARGAIVAVKGLGGFHLACDAGDEDAVRRLRERKRRYHKPFALMGRDAAMIRRYAALDDDSLALLESSAAPVVLLDSKGKVALAAGVAPGQATLGFMLPYTPLHHLLMADLKRPIVLTSGNRSDEPQCIGNAEAKRRLHCIADYWLMHDRDILNRVDDSVVRIMDGATRMLRRARGFAPAPLSLDGGFEEAPPVLAMGGQLKNTFCLLRRNNAVLSQHMGDLEEISACEDYRRNLALFRDLFEFEAKVVAVDLHPDYFSSRWGRQLATETALELEPVQHHHAHIAACMAEHGFPPGAPAVLGIALDGLGYGADRGLWGGEFLLADYRAFERIAAFPAVAMPGGAKAMMEPWRNAFAHFSSALGWARVEATYADVDIIRFLRHRPIADLETMVLRGLNSPKASSAGRLFDAAAAALGLYVDSVSFEGQAAMALEAEAGQVGLECGAYPAGLESNSGIRRFDWAPLWGALLEDLRHGEKRPVMAARFHRGIAEAVARMALALSVAHRFDTVVLCGGVFQNRLLLEGVARRLRAEGLRLLSPQRLPANDGGICLGQAVIAAARRLV